MRSLRELRPDAMLSCISAAHLTAADGLANSASAPSPVVLIRRPSRLCRTAGASAAPRPGRNFRTRGGSATPSSRTAMLIPSPKRSPSAPTITSPKQNCACQRTALSDQCLLSAEADVRPPWRKSGFDCVKKTRERHAVGEMRGGPSELPCRRRLQTAMSCFGQKPRW